MVVVVDVVVVVVLVVLVVLVVVVAVMVVVVVVVAVVVVVVVVVMLQQVASSFGLVLAALAVSYVTPPVHSCASPRAACAGVGAAHVGTKVQQVVSSFGPAMMPLATSYVNPPVQDCFDCFDPGAAHENTVLSPFGALTFNSNAPSVVAAASGLSVAGSGTAGLAVVVGSSVV